MLKNNKILNLNELKQKLFLLKKNKKKIVLCHGVFDLVHIGHIEHFKYAKSMVDILICSVTNDNFVKKGPGKPIYSARDRVSVLKNLNFFDDVIISNSETAEQVIKKIKPNIYFKGIEYRENSKDLSKNIVKEIKALKKIRGKIVYTDTKTSSSSLISNTYFNFINQDAKKFITTFNASEFLERVEKNLLKKNKKKFLLIGEPIVDSNIFVKPTGKSNKNNIISSQFINNQTYAGGSLLVANFLKSFNCEFDFLIPWNKNNSKIFKKYLNQKINIMKIKSNVNVISKIRFLDNYNYQKLYQYSKNENSIYWTEYSKEAYKLLKNKIKNYSYILIFDYNI
jgi:rfaE bifunctional protein nucleotidyltransferase chain/domain